MSTENTGGDISRRELVGTIMLLGLLGVSSQPISSASAQEVGTNPDLEKLRKVLVERLVNTRYYTMSDGSIHVSPADEVWPGESGGAYHADWLFNEATGLTKDPKAALEDSIIADRVHEGIQAGLDLSPVQRIIDNAKALGLFDDVNLIYQVLREKISVETAGAHAHGVRLFRDWALANPELPIQQQALIDSITMKYLDVARPQNNHEFY